MIQNILVVAKDRQVLEQVKAVFTPAHQIETVGSRENGLRALGRSRFDLMFIDLALLMQDAPDTDLAKTLAAFKTLQSSLHIVVLSSPDMIRKAVGLVKAGASDYLTYPIDPAELHLVADSINREILQLSELDYLRDQFWRSESMDVVQTRNASMKAVFSKIQSVAPAKTTVLLAGETGSGKGILARLIHQHSNREKAQFISVHCGAIPDTLLESELFGHEKGAFTGAVRRKLGKFEIAKGGTIFLDEIATITPAAQVKLLQVLQDGTFSRVGGEEILETDARVIAATNADLKKMCEEGQFRKDLFYRLNVFPIDIPPFKERLEDLPLFMDLFIKRLNRTYPKKIHGISPDVMAALKGYAWPGNIRELENLIERAYILESSHLLTPESFPQELFGDETAALVPIDSQLPLAAARQKAVEDFERQYLKDLMARNNGRINKSAQEAGISTRQLNKLMSKYGIHKEEFKG